MLLCTRGSEAAGHVDEEALVASPRAVSAHGRRKSGSISCTVATAGTRESADPPPPRSLPLVAPKVGKLRWNEKNQTQVKKTTPGDL